MDKFVYILFVLFGLCLYFIFTRGSVIDLKTQYVPNNIVIGVYLISISFVILSSICLKSFTPIKNGFYGFLISFIIPYAFVNGVYYLRFFSLKRKFKKKGIEVEIEKEDVLKENPKIDKKFYFIIYSISFLLLLGISIISKRYYLIGIGILALILELFLGILLKKFYVIEYNHAEDQMNKNNKEETTEEIIEEDLEVGLGDGDIILFGSMGIMFSVMGFLISFIYAVFAHMIIIVLFSLIKRINPFKYQIPFIPALSVGILVFTTGFDKYLFNFIQMINNFML